MNLVARRSNAVASDYERWLSKVATALHNAHGYEGMTAISCPDRQASVRTLLIRFRSAEALAEWEQSAVRHSFAEEGNRFSAAYYQTAPGVEAFFSVPGSWSTPRRWKMCVLTVPAVYLLLNLVLVALVRLIPGVAEWSAQVRMIPVVCIMTVLLICWKEAR